MFAKSVLLQLVLGLGLLAALSHSDASSTTTDTSNSADSIYDDESKAQGWYDACAECRCKGPRGPRGFCGERGARGPLGFRGIPGPAGEDGADGLPYTNTVFYSDTTSTVQYLQPSIQVQPLPIFDNVYATNALSFQVVDPTTITILEPGLYQFFYRFMPVYVNNIYLQVNGVTIPDSIFGIPSSYVGRVNDMNIFGQIILPIEANSNVQLWIDWDSGFGNQSAGNGYLNSGSMLIVKLNNLPA